MNRKIFNPYTEHICDDKFRMMRIVYNCTPGEPENNVADTFTIKEIWLEVERGWKNVTRFIKNTDEILSTISDMHND
jgi:hypothetical protein